VCVCVRRLAETRFEGGLQRGGGGAGAAAHNRPLGHPVWPGPQEAVTLGLALKGGVQRYRPSDRVRGDIRTCTKVGQVQCGPRLGGRGRGRIRLAVRCPWQCDAAGCAQPASESGAAGKL
jgi:hypothetical protein